jgi:hypothetical protein
MQFGERLTDLDELLLRCRDPQSKVFLAEAIACYRAGAYRSAIISTWIAVVFDLIGKFKELALTGDIEAQNTVNDIESMYLTDNIVAALGFERDILKNAREKFQLFSFIEEEDLKRLFNDRNRCAHPSLRSLEEPYQPSGELVRSHIYNAVIALLQHPPMQGRKALQSIMETIKSDSFPTQVDRALEQYFNHSPLARARPTLIKDVISVLTKNLLLEQLPDSERLREFTALQAVLKMSRQDGERILQEELPKIVRRVIDSSHLSNLIVFLQMIPLAWYALGDPGRDKARYFLEEGGPDDLLVTIIPIALNISALHDIALQSLARLPDGHLAQLIQQDPQPEYYLLEALERWKRSESFEESKRLSKQFLAPFLSTDLTAEHITQIIQVYSGNHQLYDHFFTMGLITTQLLPLSSPFPEETKEAWMQLYDQFSRFIPPDRIDKKLGLSSEQASLRTSIEERYPDIISLLTKRAQEKYAQEEEFARDDF